MNIYPYERSYLKQIGGRIRKLRGKKKLKDISSYLDINRAYLSDLEKGRRNPSLLILKRICNRFGVKLADLDKGL